MVEIVSMPGMLWFYLRVAVVLLLFLVTPILAAARLEPLTVFKLFRLTRYRPNEIGC